jgi:preprotein translocase subunit SecB
MNKTPLVFTCRAKKGIERLITGFFDQNNMNINKMDEVLFLKSPTRCNPYDRSLEWIKELETLGIYSE